MRNKKADLQFLQELEQIAIDCGNVGLGTQRPKIIEARRMLARAWDLEDIREALESDAARTVPASARAGSEPQGERGAEPRWSTVLDLSLDLEGMLVSRFRRIRVQVQQP